MNPSCWSWYDLCHCCHLSVKGHKVQKVTTEARGSLSGQDFCKLHTKSATAVTDRCQQPPPQRKLRSPNVGRHLCVCTCSCVCVCVSVRVCVWESSAGWPQHLGCRMSLCFYWISELTIATSTTSFTGKPQNVFQMSHLKVFARKTETVSFNVFKPMTALHSHWFTLCLTCGMFQLFAESEIQN